jgi:hypothetical protein
MLKDICQAENEGLRGLFLVKTIFIAQAEIKIKWQKHEQ